MRYKGWTLIGRKDSVFYFCESVFNDNNGHHGATGCEIRPVSKVEYEWASDPENVAERYADAWEGDIDSPEFAKWIDSLLWYEDPAWLMFDDSGTCDASDSFDALNIEYECTDCIGCGRIFSRDTDFDEVYNRKALVAILALEDGAVSADYAAKVVFNQE